MEKRSENRREKSDERKYKKYSRRELNFDKGNGTIMTPLKERPL